MPDWADILKSVGWPTDVLVLDFECFFSADYCMGRSAEALSTVEYVMDGRYHETGLACLRMRGDRPDLPAVPDFDHGSSVVLDWCQKEYGANLEGCTVVGQNFAFDGLILAMRHGIVPPYVVDVLGLARHINPAQKNDLASLCKRHGLQDKGDTSQFKGYDLVTEHGPPTWDAHTFTKKRRQKLKIPRLYHSGDYLNGGLYQEVLRTAMTPEMRADLAEYAKNDALQEWYLFEKLLPRLSNPTLELPLMRHTLGLFWEPCIEVDLDAGEKLATAMEEKVREVAVAIGHTPEELRKATFATVLLAEALGDEPVPMKPGKNGPIPALAKNDEGLAYLKTHPIPRVRELVTARAAVKSWPLHSARVRRILAQARAAGGRLPVSLKYAGAHTGRWSGGERVNLQNLTHRSPEELINRIRGLLMAPPEHVLVVADASQVEARGLDFVAGEDDMVEAWRNGEPIYCQFASEVLGYEVDKSMKNDRSLGKVGILGCLAEDTPVLTDRGWVRIQNVELGHRVWDGADWVAHQGVIRRGRKQCLQLRDVWMTPHHEIYGLNGWSPAVLHYIDSPAWATSSGNSPLRRLFTDPEAGSSLSNAVAPAVERVIRTETAWSSGSLHVVMSALKKHLVDPRHISPDARRDIAVDFSLEFVRSLAAAGHDPIQDTEAVESGCMGLGSPTVNHFYDTYSHYLGGTGRNWKSTGLITMRDMYPGISDLHLDRSKPGIPASAGAATISSGRVPNAESNLPSQTSEDSASDIALSPVVEERDVYDILNAGPNHRYQAGSMLVANCGYGMGANRCYDYAVNVYHVEGMTPDLAKKVVTHYRETHRDVCQLWRDVEDSFVYVTRYPQETRELPWLKFSRRDGTTIITLPSGRNLLYHGAVVTGTGRERQIKWPNSQQSGSWTHAWGGFLCIGGNVPVLTDRGWVPIKYVRPEDRVWDGVAWVIHGGVVEKGTHPVINVNGITLTPDHKILTTGGWCGAKRAAGRSLWEAVRVPDGIEAKSLGRPQVALGRPVSVRSDVEYLGKRPDTAAAGDAGMPQLFREGETYHARNVVASGLLGVEEYAGSMPPALSPGLEKLWGAGDRCLRGLASVFRGVLGRHGADLCPRPHTRPHRQRGGLLPEKLPLGDPQNAGPQSTRESPDRPIRDECRNRDQPIHSGLSIPPRPTAPVYDILDCGPRHRFVVQDGEGVPRLVHNCENIIQALCRDLLGEAILLTEHWGQEIGLRVGHHIHDEIIGVIREEHGERALQLEIAALSTNPEWLQGCPLAAEGQIARRYGK